MKSFCNTQNSGYTIMELVVVAIVVGILAGLSIPNYNKVKARNLEKATYHNLQVIRAAMATHLVTNLAPGALIPDLNGLNAINTEFNLNLANVDRIWFSCAGDDSTYKNICTGAHMDDGWQVSTSAENANTAFCYSGTCPVCNDAGSGGCSELE